jgi:hypothetical protein
MKWLSIPLSLFVLLFASACERHSASTLPAHGGSHGSAEQAGAPAHGAPAKPEADSKKDAKDTKEGK